MIVTVAGIACDQVCSSFPRRVTDPRGNPVALVSKQPAVYLLARERNGTLYIGVTSNLPKRVWEHKNDLAEGFTKRHKVHRLVYYELHGDMEAAISREKQMKKWRRQWKMELVEKRNPYWRDLWEEIL